MEKQNSLLIQDTVGNINRIRESLLPLEDATRDSLEYFCKWRSAQEIAETLKKLLTDKETTVTLVGPQQARKVKARLCRSRWTPARNAIIITAPPDKTCSREEAIIKEQDVQLTLTEKPYVASEPVLKTYNVPPGSAAEVAKSLTAEIGGRLQVIPLVGQNQIMVMATPEDHLRVAKIIEPKGKDEKPTAKTYSIKFEKAAWKGVFTWYAFESGLTRVGHAHANRHVHVRHGRIPARSCTRSRS